MEFLEIIFLMLIMAILNGFWTAYFIQKLFSEMKEHFLSNINSIDEEEDELVEVYLEFTDSLILMYRTSDNKFLAQGKTWEELNKYCIETFKNMAFSAPSEQVRKARDFNK